MYFYFFNKYNLKILEKKLLNIFKYNISSKILHELLYLGCEYSFIYNYSLNLNDFSNLIYLLVLYKNKLNNIYNNKYYEIKYNYINIFFNNYYYLKVINKIQLILNNTIYLKINPIYSNLFFFFNNKIKIKYSQLQQLIGYKGYISNIKGVIYEKPIINNYINELLIYEYILSCYGSKKGIIDTALKTADSGYLTKRLINITNNFIIKEVNCKSPFIFKYRCNMDIYGNIILPFNMLQFKILQNNIINKYKGIYFNLKNIYITKYILNNLLSLLSNIYIYLNIKSIYLCSIFNNVCNNCLGYKQLYKHNFGQHIGVISSEAIGEPSTQMVLRTFHVNSILKDKYNYNVFQKDNIYKLYSYKCKINQVFKLIFNFKQCMNIKFNLVFLINKLLFKYKYLHYNYIMINKFIKYNFIYNSISKNFKYIFNNIFIKYFNNKIKYYSLNIVQLLIKNLYNKWIIYNLYTYYFYYNYIKLYNINKKGIIYNLNSNKKLNIIYFVKSFINFYSYFNIKTNNIILNSNFMIFLINFDNIQNKNIFINKKFFLYNNYKLYFNYIKKNINLLICIYFININFIKINYYNKKKYISNIYNYKNKYNNILYYKVKSFLYLYEVLMYTWNKYLLSNFKYNLFIIYNNYIKYLYKYNIKIILYYLKNLFFINNNFINNNILYTYNIIYNNKNNLLNIYKKNIIKLLNNKLYNKIFYMYYNKNLSNLYLNDITIGLQSINIIFENKNIKNNISFISNNVYVIYYIKYYNYLNNIIYIYSVFNIYKINYFKYKLNFYSYIFEDISSILYSGYSLNTDFYLINNNLKFYFKYLLININIYQSVKSSYIYIYNILIESILKQYSYQNIYLPSIYFELIIKKMLSCIKIISNNFKVFKHNNIIPLYLINILNYSLILNKYKVYKYEPIILGITKSILANSGFLTNISFQNTFKIISLNILNNKIDWLIDIKSKIIMTDLLPVGNGWYRYLKI
ncbi:DNA-directed RNA polymerase subunit beta'', putative (apicoplast) [Plasmodium knowlesi strain H]|uniref:DNA-directed RNA polymerase n=1 Tax=Plasmodium knowlesi (strain H) TaxID=5851 RepID=A0A679L8M3_PLAKH|nr:DNA-directed RNA polymerase subunit beta'' [Plasmodium knowlesi strain H]CAA9991354.1 DNA-directed RNA polymerase subunit beta'', putative [Plasmodium knowlesi strain H]VVS80828.1 DNA-directed RNA polymerase subunit beta'', putative [Plasmodium knowlesi strain H]